jgi:hypothetical protein
VPRGARPHGALSQPRRLCVKRRPGHPTLEARQTFPDARRRGRGDARVSRRACAHPAGHQHHGECDGSPEPYPRSWEPPQRTIVASSERSKQRAIWSDSFERCWQTMRAAGCRPPRASSRASQDLRTFHKRRRRAPMALTRDQLPRRSKRRAARSAIRLRQPAVSRCRFHADGVAERTECGQMLVARPGRPTFEAPHGARRRAAEYGMAVGVPGSLVGGALSTVGRGR